MAEPDLDLIVQETIKTMGKCIKKPPMTDKLLRKPPFRFLHDVITEVIKTTGFLAGLYTEPEMNSENVTEKQAKIEFLQKAIDATAIATGASIAAKPNKIVAGYEPEHTNAFLQLIATAVKNKVNSTDAVQMVLAGGHAGDVKPEKKKDDKAKDKPKEKAAEPKEKEKEEKKEKEKPIEPKESKESKKEKAKDSKKEDESTAESDRARDRRERSSTRERSRSRDPAAEPAAPAAPAPAAAASLAEAPADDDDDSGKPTRGGDRPSTAKGIRRRQHLPQDGSEDAGDAAMRSTSGRARPPLPPGDNADEQDSGATSGPLSPTGDDEQALPGNVQRNVRQQLARPTTARAAPPRAKRSDALATEGPASRSNSASNRDAIAGPVIHTEGQQPDDDDTIVVVAPQETIHQEARPSVEDDNEEHGAVMRKILEMKAKEDPNANRVTSSLNEAARLKAREAAEKEIDELRASIQLLCRSATPLGKTLDYVQEDIDSMKKELEMWMHENESYQAQLADEANITDQQLGPLRAQLRELDQQINDREEVIRTVKGTIYQLDQKIKRMLLGIGAS